MAFGKRECIGENIISYEENIDLLLNDLKFLGYKDLTKDDLLKIFNSDYFSISSLVKMEVSRILQINEEQEC